jgi:hypothetical protein
LSPPINSPCRESGTEPCPTHSGECTAFWSGYNSVDDDRFKLRIYVDDVERAAVVHRHSGGANQRLAYSIPTSELVTIGESSGSLVTVTIQRDNGTGIITQEESGVLTARTYPAP